MKLVTIVHSNEFASPPLKKAISDTSDFSEICQSSAMTCSSIFYLFSLKATVCFILLMSFEADHLRSIWGPNIVVYKLGAL